MSIKLVLAPKKVLFNKKGSVKDRAALFLIKEGIKLKKIAHLKQKDAPPPIIVGK